MSFTYKDYESITQKDRDNIINALENKDVLFMLCDLFLKEEVSTSSYDLATELVKYDKEFLNSRTVVENIRKLLVSKIHLNNFGKVKIDNFSHRLIVHDPIPLLNFVATRDFGEG